MTWTTGSIGQRHAHRRKSSGKRALDALPPDDAAPRAFGQHIGGVEGGLTWHRMQPRLAPACLGQEQAHTGCEDLQCAGNANRPDQATRAEPLAERSPLPYPASASTQPKRTPAAINRLISFSAICGFVCATCTASGTPALAPRPCLSSAERCRGSPTPHRRRQPGDQPAQLISATAVHRPRPGC